MRLDSEICLDEQIDSMCKRIDNSGWFHFIFAFDAVNILARFDQHAFHANAHGTDYVIIDILWPTFKRR